MHASGSILQLDNSGLFPSAQALSEQRFFAFGEVVPTGSESKAHAIWKASW
jgi:hypothetical protein